MSVIVLLMPLGVCKCSTAAGANIATTFSEPVNMFAVCSLGNYTLHNVALTLRVRDIDHEPVTD